MKIGYLLELGEEIRRPPFNGPAVHIRQVVRHLARLGHEVVVLFRLEGQLWMTRDLEAFRPVGVPEMEQGPWRWFERVARRLQSLLGLPYLGFFESRRFAAACAQELAGCDILYERFTWMHYGGGLAAKRGHVPWVVEYNGDPLADLKAKGMAPSGLQLWISRRIARRTLCSADHVVASGEGWKWNCSEVWGVDPAAISVVENGTDLLGLLSRSALRSFRPVEEEGKAIRIVYLGGFYAWHGIDRLLKALPEVLRRGVHVDLTLIGSGLGEDAIRELASQLRLEDRVTFTGKLSQQEYAPILAQSDIGVSPYCGWPEYSGLKIFDYKAAGLACVASGENGRPSTLQHGKTGWIVPPCREDALTEAVCTLAENADLRRRLGQAARADAEEHHDWSHTASRLDQVFSRLTEKARPADERSEHSATPANRIAQSMDKVARK